MADQGKRLATSPHKGRKAAVIVCGTLIGVLAAGYLALCAFAGGGDSLLPNTTAAGVPLGGMDRTAATLRLEEELNARLAGMTIPFQCGDKLYEVSGDCFSAQAGAAVDALADRQRGGFLTRGAQYIHSMLTPSGQAVEVTLNETPPAVLEALSQCEGDDVKTTWEASSWALSFIKGRTGRQVDLPALLEGLTEQARQRLNGVQTGESAPVEAVITFSAPAEPDFAAIGEQVYVSAADAYFDPEKRVVVPSVVGFSLDVDKARAALAQCEEGKRCMVALERTEPTVSTKDLNAILFREVLGQAKTHCTGTQSRINNVRIAAGFMNDVILLPGETFSYLGTCGPYNTEKGYEKGLAYHGGKSVLSVGGGVCQGSSTLYYAVLRANLEVVERYNHGYEPSYIPGGMDATVASTVLDFKFKNNTEYPIRIESYMDGKNDIYVILHGTNTTGIHGEPYSKNRTVTRYAETVYEPKEDVPQGTQVKDPERTAYNGVTVEAWQKLVDAEGNVVEEYKLYTDRYSYRNAVIFYNPADADLWNIDPATGRIRETPPPTPTPAETPVPTESPAPAESPDPVITPDPAETADPVVTPDPAETADPVVTPDPAETADPVVTPDPAETADPVVTPDPAETVDPAVTPDPAETADPADVPPAPETPPDGDVFVPPFI